MNPLSIVPDEASETVGRSVAAKLPMYAALIEVGNLLGHIGMDELDLCTRLAGFAGAHEILLWARSERSYGVAWTSLAPDDEVIHTATADSAEGLVWTVFTSGRSVLQTADELQTDGWTNLEKRRGRTVGSMAGSPVVVTDRCVAVLTLVRYQEGGSETPLTRGDAAALTHLASLLGQSVENYLIRACLGLHNL